MIYEYKDLKGVIRVGDMVRAVPGRENLCTQLSDDGLNECKITSVRDASFDINDCLHRFSEYGFLDLTPHIHTWDTLQAGDKVRNVYGIDYIIQGNVGSVFFITVNGAESATVITLSEMKHNGFEIIQPEEKKEEVKEMTVADVEKLVGQKVKIVKDK